MAIQIVKEIVADVVKRGSTRAVYAKQNDVNSRFLNVRIQDDGKDIVVAPDLNVFLNAERSDKKSNIFKGTVNDNGTVKVPLASWILECEGIAICDISIVSDDPTVARLTTMSFNVYIEATAVSDDTLEDNEDYIVLVDLISKTADAVSRANATVEDLLRSKENGDFNYNLTPEDIADISENVSEELKAIKKGDKGDRGPKGDTGRGYDGNKKLTLISSGSATSYTPAEVKIPNAMLVESIVVVAQLQRDSSYHWAGGIHYGQWNGKWTTHSQPIFEDSDGDGYSEITDYEHYTIIDTAGLHVLKRATSSDSYSTEQITLMLNICNGGFVVDGTKFIIKEDLDADDEHYITIIPHSGWYTKPDCKPDETTTYAYSVYCIEREDNGEVIPEDQIQAAVDAYLDENGVNPTVTVNADKLSAVLAEVLK